LRRKGSCFGHVEKVQPQSRSAGIFERRGRHSVVNRSRKRGTGGRGGRGGGGFCSFDVLKLERVGELVLGVLCWTRKDF